jgi:GAF domain-containing protein
MATDPREWRRLMEAGAAFTAYMDLDDVLRQVLPYAAESANAEWSAVMLHDPEAHELVVAAAGGSASSVRGRRFPDTDGIAGSVLKSGNPRIVTDPGETAHLLREISRDGQEVRSLMAAPLRVGPRILGSWRPSTAWVAASSRLAISTVL